MPEAVVHGGQSCLHTQRVCVSIGTGVLDTSAYVSIRAQARRRQDDGGRGARRRVAVLLE
jgi:hypothetical protein